MLDYVSDETLAQLLAAADLAVLPYTHSDAQSAVRAQFTGHGIPLVVSNVDAWAAALEGFFANTEARRTEYRALSNRVRARCAPEAVAEAHGTVYRTLAR